MPVHGQVSGQADHRAHGPGAPLTITHLRPPLVLEHRAALAEDERGALAASERPLTHSASRWVNVLIVTIRRDGMWK